MESIETPVILGCDHAAYHLKEKVKLYLQGRGIEVEDIGTHSTDSVDYTEYGIKVSQSISEGKFERGILLCGTGLGMSMLANRYKNVRAALCSEGFSTAMSRQHNDSNILVLGGRVIGEAMAVELVRIWLETPFEGGRHQARIEKFEKL